MDLELQVVHTGPAGAQLVLSILFQLSSRAQPFAVLLHRLYTQLCLSCSQAWTYAAAAVMACNANRPVPSRLLIVPIECAARSAPPMRALYCVACVVLAGAHRLCLLVPASASGRNRWLDNLGWARCAMHHFEYPVGVGVVCSTSYFGAHRRSILLGYVVPVGVVRVRRVLNGWSASHRICSVQRAACNIPRAAHNV